VNHDLEMLIARLRWPLAPTRWWTMQELTQLLLAPGTRAAVTDLLRKQLRQCRLEAEAVELLFIFWMAVKRGMPPETGLGPDVARPSMLASWLLTDMGESSPAQAIPPLQVAPGDFEAPDVFWRVMGVDVPRIYLTVMRALEKRTKHPFERQLAFEWSQSELAYPEAPLQGDLPYFVRPLGGGATGSFANRAHLRMVTAFQRTLELAAARWNMPLTLALDYAAACLPLGPCLAFLRPARPVWLVDLTALASADPAAMAAALGNIDSMLAATAPLSTLLALSTPLSVSNTETIEIEVVRWRRWSDTPIDAESLWARFEGRQNHAEYGTLKADGLNTECQVSALVLSDVLDEETESAPMAAVQAPDRIAYLQKDLYPKRLHFPVVTGQDDGLVVKPSGGVLTVIAGDTDIATLAYWNAGWGPVHPAAISGLCGTALFGDIARFSSDDAAPPKSFIYLWKRSRHTREHSHEGYLEAETLYGTVEA
jgi:hypothetical protein